MMRSDLLGVFALAAFFSACGSDGNGASHSDGGSAGQSRGGAAHAGGIGGASGMGGSATGGTSTNGGATTGGSATGGSGTGGSATGGSANGGTSGTGGSTTGGSSNGGSSNGGSSNGGSANGGSANGGTSGKGGAANGGSSSGGSSNGGSGGVGSTNWIGTWTASPYYDSNNPPPVPPTNSVLRQVTRVSVGSSRIRIHFSNLSGNGAVALKSVHIALCKATPSVDSTIDATTEKALAFSGTASVTIAQGQEVWSDPIDFALPALGNLTITTAFGSVPGQVVGHSGSRTTSYIKASSTDVSAANMSGSTTTDHWYYISGIDVQADASAKGVVAIGDSITDGRGTDTNKNNRWTDILAARLQANTATKNVSMMNQGIGGTPLVGSGTAAEARFARDVLGISGVKYAIVLDGVNDIGYSNDTASTVTAMKNVYQKLITQAHAKGITIYVGTILPFGRNTMGNPAYYSVAHEDARKQVNTYLKSGVFDGVIDFEAALTDGGDPPKLQAAYAAWTQMDGLHPGPAGYQKMGDSVDLTLFTK